MPVDEIWEARLKQLQANVSVSVMALLEHSGAPAFGAKVDADSDEDLFVFAGDLKTVIAMSQRAGEALLDVEQADVTPPVNDNAS